MFKPLTLAAVLAVLPAVAAAADSPGDTPSGRQRVTIRGSGSSVEIERTQAPARKQPGRSRRSLPACSIRPLT